MAYTKRGLLDVAIKIVKEYARGGGVNPEIVLEEVYEKLVKLNSKVE